MTQSDTEGSIATVADVNLLNNTKLWVGKQYTMPSWKQFPGIKPTE